MRSRYQISCSKKSPKRERRKSCNQLLENYKSYLHDSRPSCLDEKSRTWRSALARVRFPFTTLVVCVDAPGTKREIGSGRGGVGRFGAHCAAEPTNCNALHWVKISGKLSLSQHATHLGETSVFVVVTDVVFRSVFSAHTTK